MIARKVFLQFAMAALFMWAGHDSYAATYDVQRIPGLSASGRGFGWGINERGEVTGWSATSNGSAHAIIYSNGVTRDIGALGGASTLSYGIAINNQGQVAGDSYLAFGSGAQHAFLYHNGLMKDLGTLGGLNSLATGLNDFGEVVGISETRNGLLHGFIYTGGQMTEIEAFIPGGINNQGQIIGFDGTNAVLYDHGTLTSLGSLAGQASYPYAMNQRGDVVGGSPTGTGRGGAFLYSEGQMLSLGTTGADLPLSLAFGINNHRAVVGEVYNNVSGIYHAFIYEDGQMRDLNTLVEMEPGMVLTDALAINDAGQIVANGNNGGPNNVSFLLTPKCQAPVLQRIKALPAVLWPPNRQMQKVAFTVEATAVCGPARSKILSITSSDAASGNPNTPDFEITGELTANLRAEKSVGGGERVYTVTIQCVDAVGNVSTGTVSVIVPRSQR